MDSMMKLNCNEILSNKYYAFHNILILKHEGICVEKGIVIEG